LERAADLKKFAEIERIFGVFVTSDPFSYKNGLLTSTQKMKRGEI
jgi:long-subunit acyl-CoA synthetase (AMP-forming)